MNYKGTIIEESLKDRRILDGLNILDTRVEPVTSEHRTPWLEKWTLHTVEIPEADAVSMAERLRQNIETEHTAWYIDYKNPKLHYIIFPQRILVVDRAKPEEYAKVTQYGVSLGIPEHQLDFSPDIQ